MGVLACDRNGCENVMCDRYNPDLGYICNECFDELVHLGFVDLEAFFNSPKRSTLNPKIDYYKVYNEMFPSR